MVHGNFFGCKDETEIPKTLVFKPVEDLTCLRKLRSSVSSEGDIGYKYFDYYSGINTPSFSEIDTTYRHDIMSTTSMATDADTQVAPYNRKNTSSTTINLGSEARSGLEIRGLDTEARVQSSKHAITSMTFCSAFLDWKEILSSLISGAGKHSSKKDDISVDLSFDSSIVTEDFHGISSALLPELVTSEY